MTPQACLYLAVKLRRIVDAEVSTPKSKQKK
jgi:hypothetical protein